MTWLTARMCSGSVNAPATEPTPPHKWTPLDLQAAAGQRAGLGEHNLLSRVVADPTDTHAMRWTTGTERRSSPH